MICGAPCRRCALDPVSSARRAAPPNASSSSEANSSVLPSAQIGDSSTAKHPENAFARLTSAQAERGDVVRVHGCVAVLVIERDRAKPRRSLSSCVWDLLETTRLAMCGVQTDTLGCYVDAFRVVLSRQQEEKDRNEIRRLLARSLFPVSMKHEMSLRLR